MGEPVDVRERLLVGVQAEARLTVDGRHPDREGVALGERDDGVDGLELAAQHVEGLRRTGDVRYDEVEGARAGYKVGGQALERMGRVTEASQRGIRSLGFACGFAVGGLPV